MTRGPTVVVPFHVRQGRRSRKELRNGEAKPAAPRGRIPRVSRLMALAIRFDRLIQDGVVADPSDDVIPISFLGLLEEIASDYHAYLVGNRRALKDQADRVILDLGLGRRALPVRRRCEERRVEIGRELEHLDRLERRNIRRVLEPVGAWHVLTLPSVLPEIDTSDPRSL